jgi:hypothetical protein
MFGWAASKRRRTPSKCTNVDFDRPVKFLNDFLEGVISKLSQIWEESGDTCNIMFMPTNVAEFPLELRGGFILVRPADFGNELWPFFFNTWPTLLDQNRVVTRHHFRPSLHEFISGCFIIGHIAREAGLKECCNEYHQLAQHILAQLGEIIEMHCPQILKHSSGAKELEKSITSGGKNQHRQDECM